MAGRVVDNWLSAGLLPAVNPAPLRFLLIRMRQRGVSNMKAVAAAQSWWAACRRRMPASSRQPTVAAAAVRIASLALLALAAAVIACALFGYGAATRSAARLEAEHQEALRVALDELHAVFGNVERFDLGQIQLLERRTGLQDLRFDSEPISDPGRESKSLLDANGRIAGWLSWAPDRALTATMSRLWFVAGIAGVALALCALAMMTGLRVLMRALSQRTETVRRLSREDAVTGLPNHKVMLEKLNAAVEARRSGFVAFVRIDLDGFREVNDTLGRDGGDQILTTMTERLRSALPAHAQLGRFEDDEFAVLMVSEDAGAATTLAEVLRGALPRPFFKEQFWQISAGIGLAQAPEHGETGDELNRRAGHALRAAKREGRAVVRRFEPRIEIEHSERRDLLRALAAAITEQSLDIEYQPIVAAAGGGIIGVEALLRWQHPTRGAIAPAVFVPLAEQSGLMPQLGEFVLRRALRDGARWPKLSISVNLSALQIRDRGIVALIDSVLAETGIDPLRVVLEVTESVLIDDPQDALVRLEALRALGVSIALDDFGTGYSSLSYLQKFPFNQLKIDRAFVASLGTTGNAGAIVQSIVTLGHALGMKVLAEGVETDEQRVLLRLAGCDEMQGFLFAKPRSAAAIDRVAARAGAARSLERRKAIDAAS